MQSLDDTLINDKYAANFNPARFVLIQYLCNRVNASEHSQNKILLEKAEDSIQQYQADLDAGRKKASLTLKNIRLNFSDHSENAQDLFEQCKFKQLEQLNARLNVRPVDGKSYSKLAQLIAEMKIRVTPKEELSSTQTLESLILTQEQQARTEAGAVLFVGSDNVNDQPALQSLKTARESMKYYNIDKSIERAIKDFPENAGPHNPHMLAITSLMNMRDLSPQYLRRFAGYIETALWLESNGVRLNRKK